MNELQIIFRVSKLVNFAVGMTLQIVEALTMMPAAELFVWHHFCALACVKGAVPNNTKGTSLTLSRNSIMGRDST